MLNLDSKPGSYDALRYLLAEKSDLYCAIVKVFITAKNRYTLHLSPGEVHGSLPVHLRDDTTEDALTQLHEWGVLEKHIDTAEVSTVEEFYNPHYLYTVSQQGIAAYEAAEFFNRRSIEKGKLDIRALSDIRDFLRELSQILTEKDISIRKGRQILQSVHTRFTDLVSESNDFFNWFQKSIVLQTMDLQSFVTYKEQLIDYLENFIRELVVVSTDISELLNDIDQDRLNQLIEMVVREEIEAEFEPEQNSEQRHTQQWIDRWQGVRSWFVSDHSSTAQAMELRSRMLRAIPHFLSVVSSLSEARSGQTDRVADYMTLARWFVEARDDEQAHALWLTACGLNSARHFTVDSETAANLQERDTSPTPSWLEAEAICFTPTLRSNKGIGAKSKDHRIVDRSAEKRMLQELSEEEARQIERARTLLCTKQKLRLSQFAELEPKPFQLLLDLLGHAFASMLRGTKQATSYSTDGSLCIELEICEDGSQASITTSYGMLTGPDCVVMIEDASKICAPKAVAGI